MLGGPGAKSCILGGFSFDIIGQLALIPMLGEVSWGHGANWPSFNPHPPPGHPWSFCGVSCIQVSNVNVSSEQCVDHKRQ